MVFRPLADGHHRGALGRGRHARAGVPVGGRRRRGDRAARPGQRVRSAAGRGPGQAVLGGQRGRSGDGDEGGFGRAPAVAAQPVPRVRQVGGRARDPRRPRRPGHGRDHHRRLDRRVQRGGRAVPLSGRVLRGHRHERQLPDRPVLRRGLEPGPVLLRAAAVPARPGRPAPGPAAAAAGHRGHRRGCLGGRRLVLADGRGPGRQRASPTGWTTGARSGRTSGTPGGRCSPSTSASSRNGTFRRSGRSGASCSSRRGRRPCTPRPGWGS